MDEQRQLKLMVVDDEEGIVDFTKKIYTREGFQTFGATDGVTAVEIFKKERPEINLIDIHMPYSAIDGVEVLRQIKDINKDAVCVMVTRITEKEKVEACRKLGALAYVLKPLDLEELDKVVKMAVEASKNLK
jgi:two-component system response regulator (stage 0 sporulation protein F)